MIPRVALALLAGLAAGCTTVVVETGGDAGSHVGLVDDAAAPSESSTTDGTDAGGDARGEEASACSAQPLPASGQCQPMRIDPSSCKPAAYVCPTGTQPDLVGPDGGTLVGHCSPCDAGSPQSGLAYECCQEAACVLLSTSWRCPQGTRWLECFTAPDGGAEAPMPPGCTPIANGAAAGVCCP